MVSIMKRQITYSKIKRKFWSEIVRFCRYKFYYPCIYRSYWHYLFHRNAIGGGNDIYFAACPNPGAGIGHQMANWIAGYWYARQFELRFAHLPFSSVAWDDFLGFGQDEVKVSDLKSKGYKVRTLPLFNENNSAEKERCLRIIRSYVNEKVVFIAEQDQFYKAQYGVMEEIQQKFYHAPARKNDHLEYSKEHFNIAIHVRRGDIMTDPSNPNLAMRYLSNDYFEKVLSQVYTHFSASQPQPIHIYFFSQGLPEDYPEFAKYPNLHWCMDMGAQDSFLHMVYADLLITSKSSFSYKPALLCKGIKVCPKNFWHGYPNSEDWIMVENDGTFDISKLPEIMRVDPAAD